MASIVYSKQLNLERVTPQKKTEFMGWCSVEYTYDIPSGYD